VELAQLLYFSKVAELESFSRAAEALYLSQPALSKAVGKLETEVGVPLFDRVKGRVFLNDAGRAFLVHAQAALAELDQGMAELTELRHQDAKTVRFANAVTVLAKDLINSYLLAHTDVRIVQELMSGPVAIKALVARKIDFAICLAPLRHESIAWERLFLDPDYAVLKQTHPLAGRDGIQLAELAGERFLVSTLHDEECRAFTDRCLQSGFRPNIVYAGKNFEVISELATSGYGVRLVPASLLTLFRDRADWMPGMAFVKLLDPHCRAEVGIATRRGQRLGEPTRAFRDFLAGELTARFAPA
jgi:DNA-binding transcriptional LysR family regulator